MAIEQLDNTTWEDYKTGDFYEVLYDEDENGTLKTCYFLNDNEISEDEFCAATQGITKREWYAGNAKIVYWLLDGNLHRLDGPARIIYTKNGTIANEIWAKNGKFHRIGGPANTSSTGVKEYFVDGVLHRTDGPAHITSDGIQYWYDHGKLHRLDGPAVVSTSGAPIRWVINDQTLTQEDWQKYVDHLPYDYHRDMNGTEKYFKKNTRVLHRTNGPALVRPNGVQEWHYEGKRHRINGPARIDEEGNQHWYYNGERHRDGAPAVVYTDGSEEWYFGDVLHRADGPAIYYVDEDGERYEYYNHGQRHRLNGPAVIDTEDGKLLYFACGQEFTEEEYERGYVGIKKDGCTEWIKVGDDVERLMYHRENGPAVKHSNGAESWYWNGLLHREDGPAYINDGVEKYFLHAVEYSKEEYQKLTGWSPEKSIKQKDAQVSSARFDYGKNVPPIQDTQPNQEVGMGWAAGAAMTIALLSGMAKNRKRKTKEKQQQNQKVVVAAEATRS